MSTMMLAGQRSSVTWKFRLGHSSPTDPRESKFQSADLDEEVSILSNFKRETRSLPGQTL